MAAVGGIDNVFIERFRRPLKYEEVAHPADGWHACDDLAQARRGIEAYVRYYYAATGSTPAWGGGRLIARTLA